MGAFLIYCMIILGLLGGIAFLMDILKNNKLFLFTAIPCFVLFACGWLGFLGQILGACNGLPFIGESFEWPVFSTTDSVTDSQGRTYVPIVSAARIQVYGRDGAFIRGWFVKESGGKALTILTNKDGNLEAYTTRYRLIFKPDGKILAKQDYSGPLDELPQQPPSKIKISCPLLLLPFANPFLAWLAGGLGMAGLFLHEKLLKKSSSPKTLKKTKSADSSKEIVE